MADLKLHTIEVAGIPHTVQLNAEDAKRMGAVEVKAASPANKAAAPANK